MDFTKHQIKLICEIDIKYNFNCCQDLKFRSFLESLNNELLIDSFCQSLLEGLIKWYTRP